jgi:chromosome segregation ATPase
MRWLNGERPLKRPGALSSAPLKEENTMDKEELLAAIKTQTQEQIDEQTASIGKMIAAHRDGLQEFVHERFRRVDEKLDLLRADMADLKPRVSGVETALGMLTTAVGRTNDRIDHVDTRLERIERRLDLTEDAAGRAK